MLRPRNIPLKHIVIHLILFYDHFLRFQLCIVYVAGSRNSITFNDKMGLVARKGVAGGEAV